MLLMCRKNNLHYSCECVADYPWTIMAALQHPHKTNQPYSTKASKPSSTPPKIQPQLAATTTKAPPRISSKNSYNYPDTKFSLAIQQSSNIQTPGITLPINQKKKAANVDGLVLSLGLLRCCRWSKTAEYRGIGSGGGMKHFSPNLT